MSFRRAARVVPFLLSTIFALGFLAPQAAARVAEPRRYRPKSSSASARRG